MSELPVGWAYVEVQTLGEVRLGRQRSPARATGPNMCRYLRAANVSWSGLALSDIKEMDFSPDEQLTYRLKEGDILIAEASGSRMEVGKSAIWRNEIPGACFQNTLIRVRTARGIDPVYLQAHLHADAKLGRLAAVSKGVGIHHLSAKGIKEWRVGIPPLNEQKRIVAKIDALTEKSRRAREALEEVPKLLEKLRQSILAGAFRGDLTKEWRKQNPNVEPAEKLLERIRTERRSRWEQAELEKMRAKGKEPNNDKWKAKYKEPKPVDTEGLPELPEGWCWANLDALVSKVGSGATPRGGQSAYQSSGTPLIRSMNVHFGKFKYENLAFLSLAQAQALAGAVVECDDVLLNITGASIGRVLCAPPDMDGARVNQHVAIIRPVGGVESGYLAAFIESPVQQRLISENESGATRQALTKSKIQAFRVPLPPIEEQKELVRALERWRKKASGAGLAASSGIASMRPLRSSILTKAFRGELVPQDPNDEPASVLLERIRAEREAEAPKKKRRSTKKKSAKSKTKA